MKSKIAFALLCGAFVVQACDYRPPVAASDYKHYIDSFNAADDELVRNFYPNDRAWEFLSANIPLFDCPDKQLEETYYFRWWTFRKHIKETPEGFIITEFLPGVGWGGPHNAISCAAAHHFNEGRWLRDDRFLRDYARFWLEGSGKHASTVYSFWPAHALLAFDMVHPDSAFMAGLFPALEENQRTWEDGRYHAEQELFWQQDGRDGMEESISGSYGSSHGYRATINSYMYGNMTALAELAGRMEIGEKADFYGRKAERLKNAMDSRLWDAGADFYKVIPMTAELKLSDVRELHGYTPWYFSIPGKERGAAWRYLMDPEYFYAEYGPTTAEQCHPLFRISYEGHECLWNGPSWPYATSVTLTALANYLQENPASEYITDEDYFRLLTNYSRCHRITFEDGASQPWIDENLNPFTGDWISRTRLKTWSNGTWDAGKGGRERGKDYNHSTFNDLVITGLVGLRPSSGGTLTVNPLVPHGEWDYFCLEGIPYKGRSITVMYDKTGKRYNRGKGYRIFVDGRQAFRSSDYTKAEIAL